MGLGLFMRLLTSFLTALAIPLLASTTAHAAEPALPDLPDLFGLYPSIEFYKVDPYIQMAVALQSLDRSAALDKLHAMAREPNARLRVIVLSRMLFAPRPGADLRPPRLPPVTFIGGTQTYWPQEPIEVVDGVPFLIVIFFSAVMSPAWDRDEEYLQYCETNGDWSSIHYSVKTTQQKREALATLLKRVGSNKAAILDDDQRRYLEDQIK